MHQIPDTDGGAYNAPPDSLAAFEGPTSKGGGSGRGKGRGKGRGGEREERGKGGEGKAKGKEMGVWAHQCS